VDRQAGHVDYRSAPQLGQAKVLASQQLSLGLRLSTMPPTDNHLSKTDIRLRRSKALVATALEHWSKLAQRQAAMILL
jgi:hypothetical protein